MVEFCYPPIIISKSSKTGYDLRYTAQSTGDNIAHKGVLLVAFGLRYKSYSANVGRTFIVDPNPVSNSSAVDIPILLKYPRHRRNSTTCYFRCKLRYFPLFMMGSPLVISTSLRLITSRRGNQNWKSI